MAAVGFHGRIDVRWEHALHREESGQRALDWRQATLLRHLLVHDL